MEDQIRPGRRLLGAAAVLGAAGAGWWAGVHYVLTLFPARGIDGLTTVAVLGAGLAVLAWYALTAAVALVCLLLRSAGMVWSRGEQAVRRAGAPALRRLLGGGAGAMLVAGSLLAPAYAGTEQDDPLPASLTWAPAAPEGEPTGTGAEPPDGEPAVAAGTAVEGTGEEAAAASSAPDPPEPSVHVVRPGQTLWSIAAEDLGTVDDHAAIAARWPQWYRANAEVIGPDPDLILPGQRLNAPQRSTS